MSVHLSALKHPPVALKHPLVALKHPPVEPVETPRGSTLVRDHVSLAELHLKPVPKQLTLAINRGSLGFHVPAHRWSRRATYGPSELDDLAHHRAAVESIVRYIRRNGGLPAGRERAEIRSQVVT